MTSRLPCRPLPNGLPHLRAPRTCTRKAHVLYRFSNSESAVDIPAKPFSKPVKIGERAGGGVDFMLTSGYGITQRRAVQPILLATFYSNFNKIMYPYFIRPAFRASFGRLVLVLFALAALGVNSAKAQCETVNNLVNASGPLSLCEGEDVTLTAPAGFSSYNWSNGSTGQSITVTAGGSYRLTVTFGSGCSVSTPLNVEAHHNPMPHVTGNLKICNGAPATADAGSYAQFNWSTGETTQTMTTNVPGVYTVTVTDANGCTGVGTANVDTATELDPMVKGGSICASTVLDAGAGFTAYAWSNGSSGQTTAFTPYEIYTLTVTNATGCSGIDTVYTMAPFPLPVTIGGDSDVCNGGVAELVVNNFGLPFVWSTGETTTRIQVTDPGVYSVSLMEGNCEYVGDFLVSEAGNVNAAILGDTAICTDSVATLSLNNSFDTYQWSDGSTSSQLDVGFAGVYRVTVTSGDCKAVAEKIVYLDAPQISITVQPATAGQDNGELYSSVEGGVEPYTYLWSNGATTADLVGVGEGTYTLTVTGSSGCGSSLTVELGSIG
ncbi:MAG TPA: SprB repeat-containing protein, partial [Chitinophagales bacterium]|nr:SprB repeat-containing protein [Chitinophagales bacterium]